MPGELDEAIGAAGDVEDGSGNTGQVGRVGRGGHGGEGGKDVGARVPEQVGEAAAVGVAGGVDATRIDGVGGAEVGDEGVDEYEVAVILCTGGGLPAGFLALGVGESAGGR